MSRLLIILLFGVTLPCLAEETTLGRRVRFSYDETRWERQPAAIPGAVVTRIANDEGDFSVIVMPEKAIAGGMTSAEARRKFIEGLTRTNTKTEDVQPIQIFGRSGFEFVGKRELSGMILRMRIVLVIDDGDVVLFLSSAPNNDPMSVQSISTVWKSIEILDRG